ncbi:T9SS type A sorting domain-containing protein [Nibribacter ruber]|uniref:T9SS type A sorting domain-containing protein n=1 Tax=Nibribacter ruber TaxID=2698458 RepID=A0A6P1P3N0_9BACT|nr:MBG domain-containing protein [Nibribacter ruber]QHL88991.1 T9SS type A sorting domain-containing protein [Nibribacter ruber]
MKIKFTLTLLFCWQVLYCAAQIGSFTAKKSLGNDMIAREAASMVSLNNKLYILGGYNTSGGPKDLTEYNPATGELKKLKNLGTGPSNPLREKTMFLVKGKLYNFSGYGTGVSIYDPGQDIWSVAHAQLVPGLIPDAGFVINDTIFITSQSSNNFYSYNIVSNTFTKRAALPGPTSRRGAVAFEINGKGYWGTGTNGGTDSCPQAGCFFNDFYEYDAVANLWTAKAPLPTGFKYGSGASVNGKGYAGLGEGYYDNYMPRNMQYWYEYNPTTNAWTKKQNLMNVSDATLASPYHIKQAAVASLGGDLYLFGGNRSALSTVYTDDLYKYNPASNTWTVVDSDLGKNRTSAVGFYSNGKIYAGGGNDSEPLRDFWQYDLSTDTWSPKSGFSSTYSERAAVEINGKGYTVGGYDATMPAGSTYNNYTDSLLEYNIAANQWTVKSPYPGGKRRSMVAVAYNGKLYAGAGVNANGHGNNKDFYEFNPASNAWKKLADFPTDFNLANEIKSFVVGDTAYLFNEIYSNWMVYKYAFATNTWTQKDIPDGMSIHQAFTFKGKGYAVYYTAFTYGIYGNLAEFSPATNTFKDILTFPFETVGQLVVPTDNSIYFGFGQYNFTQTGASRSNVWMELKFDADVSKQTGTYTSKSQNTDNTCGPFLGANVFQSLYDQEGKLFASLNTGNSSSTRSLCMEVNSLDPLQPYRTAVGKFGQLYNEKVMFFNRSLLIDGGVQGGGGRIFTTAAELTRFVQAFNTAHGTNKTLNDIRIISYFEHLKNDHDPLNNINSSEYYDVLTPTVHTYGADRYLEFFNTANESARGEIYITLSIDATPPAPTVTSQVILCQNHTATALTATGTSLKWYTSATSGTGSSTAPVPNTNTVGTTSYWVTQTKDNTESARAKIDVTVNPLPGALTGSNTWPSTMPHNVATTFAVNAQVGATSYTWTVPTGFVINAGQGTTSIQVTGSSPGASGEISVRAGNACGQGPALSKMITVGKATPTVTFNNVTRTYSPGAFTLAATSNSTGAITYTLVEELTTTYPGNITLSGTGNATVQVVKSGKVKVKATVAEDGAYVAGSKEMELTITKAAGTVTLSNLEQAYNGQPKPVSVTTNPAGLQATVKYDGSATVPSAVGTYAVTASILDDNYTGEGSGTLVIKNLTAAPDEVMLQSISLFPNPTTGRAMLDVKNGLVVQVSITDLAGRMVMSQTLVKGKMEVNLEGKAPGVYLVKVHSESRGTLTFKLYKQ